MAYEISPPAPGWLDRIQFIRYYMANPCQLPGMLYIETALPIAGEIAVEYLSVDVWSYIKRSIRPKQLRSQRHGRRGRRGGQRLPGIPEVTDIIHDTVDSERRYRLPPSFGKTAALLVLDDTWERAQNLAFVLEKSIDLPYQTIIGVIRHDPKKCAGQGAYLRGAAINGITALGGPNQAFTMSTLEYAVNTSAGNPVAWFPGGGTWSVVLEMEVRQNTNNQGQFSTRLVDTIHGGVIAESSPATINRDTWTTVMCAGTVPAGGGVGWQATLSISSATMRNLKVFGLRNG